MTPKTPYQHHHGRGSLDDYIQHLPKPIRKAALRHRTKDWAFIHVWSTDQAILRVIDKDTMSVQELAFWREVFEHYLYGYDMPSVSNFPDVIGKTSSPPLTIPEHSTKVEMIRIVFRNAGPRPLSSDDVYMLLLQCGQSIEKRTIQHNLSYLRSENQLEIAGRQKNKYRNSRKKKLYRWIG